MAGPAPGRGNGYPIGECPPFPRQGGRSSGRLFLFRVLFMRGEGGPFWKKVAPSPLILPPSLPKTFLQVSAGLPWRRGPPLPARPPAAREGGRTGERRWPGLPAGRPRRQAGDVASCKQAAAADTGLSRPSRSVRGHLAPRDASPPHAPFSRQETPAGGAATPFSREPALFSRRNILYKTWLTPCLPLSRPMRDSTPRRVTAGTVHTDLNKSFTGGWGPGERGCFAKSGPFPRPAAPAS